MTTYRQLMTTLGLLAGLAGTGVVLTVSPEAGGGHPAAAQTVLAMTSGSEGEAAEQLPDDFADVMGYRPVVDEGRLVRADGSCSSPVGLPTEFEAACREHDLGYDLLRYAHRSGQPLGTWARDALDTHFGQRLLLACPVADPVRAGGCTASAHVAAAAVEINSARQLDGPPEETAATRVMTAAGALGLLAGAGYLVRAVPGRRSGAEGV